MFSLVIQVVFIGGVLSSETALDSHPTLLSSIADVGNYDPLLIIPRRQLPAMMRDYASSGKARAVPLTIFTPEEASKALPKVGSCAADADALGEYHSAGGRRSPRLLLALVEDARQADLLLDGLAGTATDCPDRISPGHYHPGNAFVLHVLGAAAAAGLEDRVFSDRLVRRHRRVAVLLRRSAGSAALSVRRYDPYSSEVVTTGVWVPGGPEFGTVAIGSMFPDFSMQGFEIRVGACPYEMLIENNFTRLLGYKDPREASKEYRHGEARTFLEVCKALGCVPLYSNPRPQFQWGTVANGTSTGLSGMLARGEVDVTVGAVFGDWRKQLVASFGTPLYAGGGGDLTFAAPRAVPKRTMYILLKPLNAVLWLSLGCSLACLPLVLVLVARAEEKVAPVRLPQWSHYLSAGWYGVSTFIGENVTRNMRSTGAWALRCVCCAWMTFALVVTASYGGNLRAYLGNPDMTKPIDSIEEMVRSGLPWYMPLFGGNEEHMLSTSSDPILKEIWDKKIVVDVRQKKLMTEKLTLVYEGKAVLVAYHKDFPKTNEVLFTLPNGEKLVHIPTASAGFLPSSYTFWAFHPMNPWKERFDAVLGSFRDAGLDWVWFDRGVARVVAKAKERYRLAGVETPAMREMGRKAEGYLSMELEDLAGIFVVLGLGVSLSAVVAAKEMDAGRWMQGGWRRTMETRKSLMHPLKKSMRRLKS